MLPIKPYLFEAYYNWLLDNNWTPYMAIDLTLEGVLVPSMFHGDKQLVLNIEPSAINNFLIDKNNISFQARFNGSVHNLYIPMLAIVAIYSEENGKGTVFTEEDDLSSYSLYSEDQIEDKVESSPENTNKKKPRDRSHLTLVE